MKESLQKVLGIGAIVLTLSGCTKIQRYFHKGNSSIEQTVKSMSLEDSLKEYTPSLCSNAVSYKGFYNGYDEFTLAPPDGTVYGAKTGKTYTLIDFANAFFISDDEVISMTNNFLKEYASKIEVKSGRLKIKREGPIRIDVYSTFPINGRTIKQPYGYHILWKPNEVLRVQREYIQKHIEIIQNQIINRLSL